MMYTRSICQPNFPDAWVELLGTIWRRGRRSAPRGQATKELIAVQLSVSSSRLNLLTHPGRDLNYRFALAEWLWIAAGREDVASIASFNQAIAGFSDDGDIFRGAYGPRLKDQWAYVLDCLRKDPDSRQAVASIWTPCPGPSKDIPCTTTFQLLLRPRHNIGKIDVLHGIVTMRSSDVWLGLPYDFFNFSMMLNSLAGQLGVETGSLTFHLGSSHLYERNFDQAVAVVHSPVVSDPNFVHGLWSPQLPGWPPPGLWDSAAETNQTGTLGRIAPTWDATIWGMYHRALTARTKAACLEVLRAKA